jgi:putative hydrolase of the HAD superfamily
VLKVVSFDLDGTLIRKGFDDTFWNQLIPEIYARNKSIGFEEAQRFILEEYARVGPDDARWYIPEYWFERFGIDADIHDVLNKVRYHEGIYDDVKLLSDLSKNYRIVISTNNPRTILEHKLRLLGHVNKSIYDTFSAVSDFNNIVKSREFYSAICWKMRIEPEEMLHIGDDPKHDLEVPASIGIRTVLIDRENNVEGRDIIHSLEELVCILKSL